MSKSWGHWLNFFRSSSLSKSILLLRKRRIDPLLYRPLIFKRIELMTSTWAHFEEQTQLSKNESSWGLQLNLFRSNRFPRWMLLLGMKPFPQFNFCWLPNLIFAGHPNHLRVGRGSDKQVLRCYNIVTDGWAGASNPCLHPNVTNICK